MRFSAGVALLTGVLSNGAAAQQGGADAPQRSVLPVVGSAFFAVSVSDLDASTEWYGRILGVEPVRDVVSRDGRARARILRRGNLVVEVIAYEGSAPRGSFLGPGTHALQMQGLFKTGLFVADAEAFHAQLQDRGVDVDRVVMLDEALQWQTFVFRDPDGNRIQVFAH
jgi:methylmalonyl-CoA/ethylmalonyl-CoA epimerase